MSMDGWKTSVALNTIKDRDSESREGFDWFRRTTQSPTPTDPWQQATPNAQLLEGTVNFNLPYPLGDWKKR